MEMTKLEQNIKPSLFDHEGDHDKFKHYVRKDALELAILEGVPCVALCGKRWLPQSDPSRFPICQDCKRIWEAKEDA